MYLFFVFSVVLCLRKHHVSLSKMSGCMLLCQPAAARLYLNLVRLFIRWLNSEVGGREGKAVGETDGQRQKENKQRRESKQTCATFHF